MENVKLQLKGQNLLSKVSKQVCFDLPYGKVAVVEHGFSCVIVVEQNRVKYSGRTL